MLTDLGRGLIDKSVARGNMTRAEADGLIRNLDYLSQKYGFTPDQFVLVFQMETSVDGTINPRLINFQGCGGLFQHCNPQDIGTTSQEVVSLGADGQTAPNGPIDRWLNYIEVIEQSKGNRSLEMLYSSVYCPAAMRLPTDNTPVPPDCKPWNQAKALRNPDGTITRASMRRGLLQKASQALGREIKKVPDGFALGGFVSGRSTSLPGSPGGSTPAGLSFFQATRESCDQPFFQLEAHEWAGCLMKMLSAISIGGPSVGPPTPGFGSALANGEAGGPGYTGPLTPGQFIKPTKGVLTSRFGPRKPPIPGASTWHRGIDIGAPIGTPVWAADAGVVEVFPFSKSAGNWLTVKHANSCTVYMHLDKIIATNGASVNQGDTIGLVGNTGNSSGSHLHFEVRATSCDSQSAIDPLKVLPPF